MLVRALLYELVGIQRTNKNDKANGSVDGFDGSTDRVRRRRGPGTAEHRQLAARQQRCRGPGAERPQLTAGDSNQRRGRRPGAEQRDFARRGAHQLFELRRLARVRGGNDRPGPPFPACTRATASKSKSTAAGRSAPPETTRTLEGPPGEGLPSGAAVRGIQSSD